MARAEFKWYSFFIRFAFALILVFATYNPSGYSYYHWLVEMLPGFDPIVVFAGVVLAIGWTMFIRATLRSLGIFGLALAFAFFGTLLWVMIDRNWIETDSTQVITYIILVLLSAVLSTGMSWSHIRRRLSGQVDVDEIDED